MFDSILNDPASKKRKVEDDTYSSQDSITEELEEGKIVVKAESDVAITKNIKAINATLNDLNFSELKLRDTEVEIIKNTVNLLRPLEEFSTLLGVDKYVSASAVLPAKKCLAKHLESNDDDPTYISDIKNFMKDDLLELSNLNYEVLTKCTKCRGLMECMYLLI